jgi:hypothetical protein
MTDVSEGIKPINLSAPAKSKLHRTSQAFAAIHVFLSDEFRSRSKLHTFQADRLINTQLIGGAVCIFVCPVQTRFAMDRCLANNEHHATLHRHRENCDTCGGGDPWDMFNLPKTANDDGEYWSQGSPHKYHGGMRHRSSTPLSEISSTGAMSPATGYGGGHGGDYPPLSPPSPDDDDGSNPVENLHRLNLTDTMRTAWSLGSSASSHRSSSSSAVSWDSNLSGGDSAAAIPSFSTYALRYVSRPDRITGGVYSAGGTFRRSVGGGVPGSVRQVARADEAANDGQGGGGGLFRRHQAPQPTRRLAEVAISEEEAVDVAALDELIGGRRVRKSFMQSSKKSTGKKKTPSIVQQLLNLRGSRTLPRGALGGAATACNNGDGDANPDNGDSDLFEALHLFKGTSLEEALLPPRDYADNSPPHCTHSGDREESPLPARGFAGSSSIDAGRCDGKMSPAPSLSDVEMPSKPPSRESSFRGEDAAAASAGTAAPSTGHQPMAEPSPAAVASALSKHLASVAVGPHVDGPRAAHPAGRVAGTGTAATACRKVVSASTATTTTPDRASAEAATPVAAPANTGSKRIYGCTVPDCGKVYTKSSHLKSHMRSHTGQYTDVVLRRCYCM